MRVFFGGYPFSLVLGNITAKVHSANDSSGSDPLGFPPIVKGATGNHGCGWETFSPFLHIVVRWLEIQPFELLKVVHFGSPSIVNQVITLFV